MLVYVVSRLLLGDGGYEASKAWAQGKKASSMLEMWKRGREEKEGERAREMHYIAAGRLGAAELRI